MARNDDALLPNSIAVVQLEEELVAAYLFSATAIATPTIIAAVVECFCRQRRNSLVAQDLNRIRSLLLPFYQLRVASGSSLLPDRVDPV